MPVAIQPEQGQRGADELCIQASESVRSRPTPDGRYEGSGPAGTRWNRRAGGGAPRLSRAATVWRDAALGADLTRLKQRHANGTRDAHNEETEKSA